MKGVVYVHSPLLSVRETGRGGHIIREFGVCDETGVSFGCWAVYDEVAQFVPNIWNISRQSTGHSLLIPEFAWNKIEQKTKDTTKSVLAQGLNKLGPLPKVESNWGTFYYDPIHYPCLNPTSSFYFVSRTDPYTCRIMVDNFGFLIEGDK